MVLRGGALLLAREVQARRQAEIFAKDLTPSSEKSDMPQKIPLPKYQQYSRSNRHSHVRVCRNVVARVFFGKSYVDTV